MTSLSLHLSFKPTKVRNASIYKVEQLQWTQTSYIQPQIHPYDLYFFDPDTLNYTVPKYLADLKQR